MRLIEIDTCSNLCVIKRSVNAEPAIHQSDTNTPRVQHMQNRSCEWVEVKGETARCRLVNRLHVYVLFVTGSRQIDTREQQHSLADDYINIVTLETDIEEINSFVGSPAMRIRIAFTNRSGKNVQFIQILLHRICCIVIFSHFGAHFINLKRAKKSNSVFLRQFSRMWWRTHTDAVWVTIKKSFKFLNHKNERSSQKTKKKNLQVELNCGRNCAPFLFAGKIFRIFLLAYWMYGYYNVCWRGAGDTLRSKFVHMSVSL